MTDAPPPPRLLVDVDAWLDAASRDALDLVTESVVEMAGFAVAALSVVRDDLVVTVTAQGAEGVREALMGAAAPVDQVLAELALGDDWGHFRHVPVSQQDPELDQWTWTPGEHLRQQDGESWLLDEQHETADDVRPEPPTELWDLHDLCMAPLLAADGQLIGVLSIDLPLSGRLPTRSHRDLLNRYAAQAERSVRSILEREELNARVRLAETARQVIRLATSRTDLDRAFEECRALLMDGYRADFMAIRAYSTGGFAEIGSPREGLGGDAMPHVRKAVQRCWAERRVGVVEGEATDPTLFEPAHLGIAVARLDRLGVGLAMIVPVGSGDVCLGHMIVGRRDVDDAWSVEERAAILDVASDIGQAVRSARTLAREQELSTYKSELLSTVSHELKNPLAVVAGHLELLDADTTLSEDSQFSVSAMGRATRRVQRVVDNLLLLAEFDSSESDVDVEPVALGDLVDDALELVRFAAQQRNLTVRVNLPDHPVLACGVQEELDRVLTNLLSNAVKYTPRDRAISISAVDHGAEVELTVADQGIGISADDRAELFTEFFRSSNPRALAQSGTGLGLVICARIVARHQGRIEVESELGVGSIFRVFLPAPVGVTAA